MSTDDARTPFSQLLAQIQLTQNGQSVHIAPDWLQGRAVYGGLSTALCLAATLGQYDDLPPLRSVEVAFVGPTGADVDIRTEVLRRGKSTAFVRADLYGADQLAVSAQFCFGAARVSALKRSDYPMPAVSSAEQCPDFFNHGAAPNYTAHFEARHALGPELISGSAEADICAWVRHRDGGAGAMLAGLVALADALPPAAMTLFTQLAPISSMTWHFDVLAEQPQTEDGWWLCRSTAESIGDGYTSQRMAVWNSRGEPVILGRQNVAIFA